MSNLRALKILPWESVNERVIRFCDGTYVSFEDFKEREIIEKIPHIFSLTYVPEQYGKIIDKLKSVGIIREFNVPKSLYIIFKVTQGCNLSCKYCYEWSTPEKLNLSVRLETVDMIFKKLIKKSKTQFIFHGGEPLLLLDSVIAPTIEKYHNPNIKWAVQTNGTLFISSEILHRLKYLQRKYGLGIGVSIDGLRHHNIMRVFPDGRESWETVVEGIQKAISYGIQLGSIVIVNKYSVSDMVDIIKFLNELGIRGTRLNPLYPAGHLEILKMMPRAEDYDKNLTKVVKWLIDYNSGIDDVNNKFVVSNIQEMVEALFGYSTSVCQTAPCGAGKNLISIDYLGNMYPCDHLSIPLGNIHDVGDDWELNRIWENQELNKFWINSARRLREKYNSVCGKCRYRFYCNGGGCPAFHLEMIGADFYSRPGVYCLKNTWEYLEKLIASEDLEAISNLMPRSVIMKYIGI